MRNYKFLLLGICVCCFLSCEDDDPIYYNVPEGLMDYGYFKQGTYWIYRNSYTGKDDSIWVTGIEKIEKKKVDGKKVVGVYEKYIVNYESNNNIGYSQYLERENVNWSLLDFSEYDNNIDIQYGFGFFYNIDKFSEYSYSDDSVLVYDSLKVADKWFYDIVYKKSAYKIFYNDDSIKYDTLDYWIAKNIGVVKKIIRNDYQTAEYGLIRYNVVQ